MSQNQSAKPGGPKKADRNVDLTPYTVAPRTKLAGALRLGLPADVTIEIVPKTTLAKRQLEELRRRHLLQISGMRPDQPSVEALGVGPRGRALLRGVKMATEDLKTSQGAYSLEHVQLLLNGISRQAIDRRVKEGSLLAVPGLHNKRMYPVIQFTDDRTVVAGMKQVAEALPTKNPWAVLNFLVNPYDRLGGRRPIDVMLEGNAELVVQAAKSVGQQGS